MNAKDWTLLALSATGGKPLSPVQLQKALFLVGKEIDAAELGRGYYRFSPYDYGPFCSDVYADAERLQEEGLATISLAAPRSWREYSATGAGAKKAHELRQTLAPATAAYLDRLIAWILPLSFDQLVRAVYKKYPEMAANSVFRG